MDLEFDWEVDWGEGDPEEVRAYGTRRLDPLQWSVRFEVLRRGNEFHLGEVVFSPDEPGVTPHSDLVTRLRLNSLLRRMERELRSPLLLFMLPGGWDQHFELAPRPGRQGRDSAFYAEWVRRYMEALDESPKTPVKWLAENNPGYTADAIRALLNKARSRGLLTKAERGKPGGTMTDECKRLLRKV